MSTPFSTLPQSVLQKVEDLIGTRLHEIDDPELWEAFRALRGTDPCRHCGGREADPDSGLCNPCWESGGKPRWTPGEDPDAELV